MPVVRLCKRKGVTFVDMTLTEFITEVTTAVSNYGVFIAGGFVLGAIGYLVRKLSKSGR